MKSSSLRFFSLIVVFLMGSLGYAQSSGALRLSGSSTIQPLAEKMAELYSARQGAKARVEGGGSGVGVRDALSGASDLGMVSRSLSADEKRKLLYTTVGYDALVFIVNSENPLEAVQLETVRQIFSGSVKNWKDVGGSDAPIITVNKEIGRSTLELFEGYTGMSHPDRKTAGKAGTIDLSHEVGSNLEMATIVGGLPHSVGYLSFGTASLLISKGMPIKILKLDGVEASVQTILSGRYGILRELNLVYLKETKDKNLFVNLFLGAEGKKHLEALGFIPGSSQGKGK